MSLNGNSFGDFFHAISKTMDAKSINLTECDGIIKCGTFTSKDDITFSIMDLTKKARTTKINLYFWCAKIDLIDCVGVDNSLFTDKSSIIANNFDEKTIQQVALKIKSVSSNLLALRKIQNKSQSTID